MKEDVKMRKEALVYHAKPYPGKIEIVPTKKYSTQRDLSLAYSPGVAFPCLEIEKDSSNSYKYTNKGNLVAVISNGTAVLGLGDIGAEASKPVMEGKGLLFKIFAGIDVYDIEINTKDPDEFIKTVKAISPTFGGINLEDIKAPEAFEIEKRLKEELDIPVMHDDQHGTAIISCAALLNAVELVKKKLSTIKVIISGAGAAAISCARMYKSVGIKSKNILMLDSKGVIKHDRRYLDNNKKEFATHLKINTLEEAMKGADVFIGLSIGNIVSEKMLLSMAKRPIVFALANPDPEINYDIACKTRKDIIMATGRSDNPNQVNNVLGFPFIFRGALDVRATKINEEMKKAAAIALAELAKKPVPEQVNIAYEKTQLTFGKDYIIPKPLDPRLITEIPPAVAKAAMDSGVATQPIKDWKLYEEMLNTKLNYNNKLIRLMQDKAKLNPKRIVYSEADHYNVLKAAQIVYEEKIGIPILLGNEEKIKKMMQEINFEADIKIIDTKSDKCKEIRKQYTQKFWELQKRKGIDLSEATRRIFDRTHFGTMMVREGDADVMLCGYSKNYPSVLKPILQIIEKSKGVNKISAMNLIITKRGPMFFSDTSINIEPTDKDLITITLMTAQVVKMFGINPVIAMLSYSNFGSSPHADAKKVREAVNYLHRFYPDLIVDGEIQADFAFNGEMLKERFPFSVLKDNKVNTFIFPNLDSANITYKLMKEANKALSVGPILMGMNKPVHILQLGASVEEIINMSTVGVIDAQKKERL